jgi:alkyl sulfatase BDS1-like metallo-beta-lactamase superfamily hydrolase
MNGSALQRVASIVAAASLSVAPAFGQPASDAPKPASPATRTSFAALLDSLPFTDREDFALADRGFIDTLPAIRTAYGAMIRDLGAGFFDGPSPATVNPSLWRDAQLLSRTGLFKVADRIYQVRGFNISNMSIIVGDTGFIIVDPGSADELTRAGIALVRSKLGDKPVAGVIYTHSHIDHYGGVGGVIDAADARTRKVPIVAPEHFVREVVSENVIAGPAMGRRIIYMAGMPLGVGPSGTVGIGIGPAAQGATRAGTVSLIPPTRDITHTGEEMTIDGVRFVFQITPNTEAPAEMNFFLPDLHALCLAENANGSMHNILTPRGALVRDAKAWADYLTESISLFGGQTDVLFTSHFWPHWGRAKIVDYLALHRDAYKYLHDQSVRLMNDGLTGPEIAETIKLPDAIGLKWFNRGYYGTMRFNAKAVYQRYMGWYDGNPATLDALPPEEAGKHYVEAMGGPAAVEAKGAAAIAAGDYRWASELLSRLVFADPDNQHARNLLADSLEQQGYQAESAVWRNMFLSGALELRKGGPKPVARDVAGGSIDALPVDLLLDMLAVRLVPERALANPMAFELSLGDEPARRVEIRNGVLIQQPSIGGWTGMTIAVPRAAFIAGIRGAAPAGSIPPLLLRFAQLFEVPKAGFGLVLPKP